LQRLRNKKRKESFRYYSKKNAIEYAERNEERRREFIEKAATLPDDVELFYADESGFDEYYSREYGYAPRGEKVIGRIKGRRFVRTSIVAALKDGEIIAPFAFNGTMDGNLFEGWLENVLVPTFRKPEKSVLLLDNAAFHRKQAILDIAEDYGFSVIFLPPYSPDLNPIEKLWANTKRRLRLHMHKFSEFWEALRHAFQ
jgi:transposase